LATITLANSPEASQFAFHSSGIEKSQNHIAGHSDGCRGNFLGNHLQN
jgi:hypothetical protein